MKRAHAAAIKQTELSRQRALVRSLIELNGWYSRVTNVSEKTRPEGTPLPSNIIPFPTAEQRSRIS